MTTSITTATDPDNWRDWSFVRRACADQLLSGHLALVVGAGVSSGFKLPNWQVLTDRIVIASGTAVPPGDLTLEEIAELVWSKHCGRNDEQFALLVREALYRDYDFDLATLNANHLLAAIGALVLPSRLGGIRQVVSFNFDEVLETYLGHLGFLVDSIPEVPCWASHADVAIMHPHGLLPRRDAPKGHLVFTSASFGRVVGNIANSWHQELLALLSSHFCLFVGLSGKDENLMTLVQSANSQHAARGSGFAYWGVRLAAPDDGRKEKWEERGVVHVGVEHAEIPRRLFTIREEAGRLSLT